MRSGEDCYAGFNLLVRRKAKENNFRSVLETIRDLMNMAAVGKAVPPWLHDIFLGYGDPSAAYYKKLRAAELEEEEEDDDEMETEGGSSGSVLSLLLSHCYMC